MACAIFSGADLLRASTTLFGVTFSPCMGTVAQLEPKCVFFSSSSLSFLMYSDLPRPDFAEVTIRTQHLFKNIKNNYIIFMQYMLFNNYISIGIKLICVLNAQVQIITSSDQDAYMVPRSMSEMLIVICK